MTSLSGNCGKDRNRSGRRKIKGNRRKKQRLAKTPRADQFLGIWSAKIEDCALDYAEGLPLVRPSFTARNFNASRCHSEASIHSHKWNTEYSAPSRTPGRRASASGIATIAIAMSNGGWSSLRQDLADGGAEWKISQLDPKSGPSSAGLRSNSPPTK